MKKNEIALLILIVSVCLGIGYFVGQSILGNRVSKPVSVEAAEAISPDVVAPDKAVFNSNGINPTVPVNISEGNNQQPFGG